MVWLGVPRSANGRRRTEAGSVAAGSSSVPAAKQHQRRGNPRFSHARFAFRRALTARAAADFDLPSKRSSGHSHRRQERRRSE
jgi:hypothetical protein